MQCEPGEPSLSKGVNNATHPPGGSQTETGSLTASSLPLFPFRNQSPVRAPESKANPSYGSSYDTKLHLRVKLQFWSSPSLSLLPGSLCPVVIVLARAPSIGQADPFKNYSYSIGPCEKGNLQKQLYE